MIRPGQPAAAARPRLAQAEAPEVAAEPSAATGGRGAIGSGSGGADASPRARRSGGEPTGSGGRARVTRACAARRRDRRERDASRSGKSNILVPAQAPLGVFYGADDIAATTAEARPQRDDSSHVLRVG